MPIPEPKEDEEQDDYVSRCIAFLIDEGLTQEQASAICHAKWEDKE